MLTRLNPLYCLVLLLAGCVSLEPRPPAPRFDVSTSAPVAIRLTDERPAAQRGNIQDPDWIYFQMQGSGQADLFTDYLGNALSAMGASPGYVVLAEDAPIPSSGVLIDVVYQEGYSRWPRNVRQQGTTVPVEGRTKISYDIYSDGKGLGQGTLEEATPDFQVPVSIVTRENVRRIVSESLAYQFNKTTTDCLDEFLWRIHSAWQSLK